MAIKAVLKRFFSSIFIVLNILSIIWLLMCKYVSVADLSERYSYLNLLSFTNFFSGLANLFFIVFWLFTAKKKWLSLCSIVALVISWSVFHTTFGMHPFRDKPVDQEKSGIKVMTWNVHLFDLGEWTRDKTSKQKIIDFIKNENPDVLCLQEFYVDENDEPYVSILRQMGYPYFEFSEEGEMKKSRITSAAAPGSKISIGHAVFSKYPLKDAERYALGNSYYNILTVNVVVDENIIFSLGVTHLASVGLSAGELDYIEDLKDQGNNVTNKRKQTKTIIKRLNRAFKIRTNQANIIDSIKSELEYPIILCGDFNDVPGSYVYTKVKGDLSDAFVSGGFGFDRTYRHILPTLRIDYILYDDAVLEVDNFRTPDPLLSDHIPVISNFTIKSKANKMPENPTK